MKRILSTLAFSVAALVAASCAQAALNAYLQLKGSKTAKFNNASVAGWYPALCTNEALKAIGTPGEPASGQATGKRTHKPLRVRMYYDAATQGTALRKAFQTKEPIPRATLLMHQPATAAGNETVYFKVVLSDCRVTQFQLGTMDGRPSMMLELTYTSFAHQAVFKTVKSGAWMTDINFGAG